MTRTLYSRENRSGRGRLVFTALVALLLGIVLGALLYSRWVQRPAGAGLSARQQEDPEETTASGLIVIGRQAQETAAISVAEAALRSMQTTLSVTGVVGPNQARVAHIRPLARGVVHNVFVSFGDRVSPDEPLIEYDNIELGLAISEYLGAQAELDRSHTDLDVKRTILARSREMLEVGAIARTTYDIQEAQYRDAEATVRSHRAVVTKFEEQIHRFGLTDEDLQVLTDEDGRLLHRTSSNSFLRAPFSGVITNYEVAEGELVDPSDELLTITDISSVWVLADVYEKDLAHVRAGQTVDIRVASYTDQVFRGKITYISDVIEPATRTAKVRCVVPNPASKLKLEMFATVEIPTSGAMEILAVPVTAIQQVEGRPVVFLQRARTEFEKRDVETGVEDRGWVEIRSGLSAGDPVVTDGSFYLKSALLRELIGGEE